MKPPYYHTLVEALSHKDRSGLPAASSAPEAESIRKVCLDNSLYGSRNRMAWAQFVEQNPEDQAARYMRPFVQ